MLDLQILSPQGAIYNDSVDEISLPTENGEIEILTNHIPLYSKLIEGVIAIKKGTRTHQIAITGGFIEVADNKVSVLSDYAIEAQSIQIAKAQEAKKRAEELLKNKVSDADILIAEKELQKSIMELKVAEKIKRNS